MKGTDLFRTTIQAYLEQRAQEDALFSERFTNPQKNIDDCVTYILNTVKKSGCCGFADEEIYSMAMHYYDEEDIEVGTAVDTSVVVNHTVELTAEEKEQARKEAMQRAQEAAYRKMMEPKKAQKKATVTELPTLF